MLSGDRVDENDYNKAACEEVAGVEELLTNLSLRAVFSCSLLNIKTGMLADRNFNIADDFS